MARISDNQLRDLLYMAVSYAIGRKSILCTTFPNDVVEIVRMNVVSDEDRKTLATSILDECYRILKFHNGVDASLSSVYGSDALEKLIAAMVELPIKEIDHTVFNFEGSRVIKVKREFDTGLSILLQDLLSWINLGIYLKGEFTNLGWRGNVFNYLMFLEGRLQCKTRTVESYELHPNRDIWII